MTNQINILLIGSGGREHAIADNLVRTSKNKTFLFTSNTSSNNTNTIEFTFGELYIAPGNPATAQLGKNVKLDTNNHIEVYNFCIENSISLIVIGPEIPLANGLVDDIIKLNHQNNTNILCFGPEKYAANLEASKAFSKDFMQRHYIPTAAYQNFNKSQKNDAISFAKSLNLPIVIKADGLAAGKGVIIAESYKEAENSINEIFEGAFGASGDNIVIEEFMDGEEASIFAICDGNDYVILPSAQDHKRIGDGDKGKNTGGMGAYSPAPIVNDSLINQVKSEIIDRVLSGLKSEGHNYIGCLYVGLMIKDNYAKVVEFNSRFGDPETQVVLSLFEGNLLELFYTSSAGNISKKAYIENNNQSCCTVILASKGYPDNFEKGNEITGINKANELTNIKVYFAGVSEIESKFINSGGRVLAVTAIGENLENAINQAYKAVELINFENKYYRTDIGQKGLAKLK